MTEGVWCVDQLFAGEMSQRARSEWWESGSMKLVALNYYGGVVDDVDEVLEAHRRETLSTFGTRTSVKKSIPSCSDENEPPSGKTGKVISFLAT